MAKKQTSAAAYARAEHLAKAGLQNEKLVNKWKRIAKKLAKTE